MTKTFHLVICVLAAISINRIKCIKLTRENVIILGGVDNNFEGKRISEIDPLALEVITSTTLYLANNELTEIAENFFEKNAQFQTIRFNRNRIIFLHPNTFKNLMNLKYLSLETNQLNSFDLNLLSSSKQLHTLYLNDNNLTEIDYQDSKLRFPELKRVAFTQNKFNCSFAMQFIDYLEKGQFSIYSNGISCISDEEYAAIVRDRPINTLISSPDTNMQLNLAEQCYNITMELKTDIADMKTVIEGLKLQLLEQQSITEKVKIDIEAMKIVTEGLKVQRLEHQSVTEKGNDDSEKVKIDMKDVIKGLKLQLFQLQFN